MTNHEAILKNLPQPTLPNDSLVTKNRRKLLFLAYSFPPARAIASVRSWSIAVNLARLGWDVIVVTPDPSVRKHVDDPSQTLAALDREGIRRILVDHKWRCLLPDSLNGRNSGVAWLIGGVCRRIAREFDIDRTIGWVKACERACSTLTANDVDLILASGPPFSTFRLANRLAGRLGRPYVLDYRDPWTNKPHTPRSPRRATVQEEARLLEGCAAATIVSPSLGLDLDQRFQVGRKLHVVTNGYNSEELADIVPYHFGHFAIVYVGTFYPPKRVISPVLAALKSIKGSTDNKAEDWYFHYYGAHEDHVRKEAKKFEVMHRVVLHGMVPRRQALSAARGASVCVVITSVEEDATIVDKGIVPGKLFELLGLGVPLLLVVPPGSDIETIARNTGGVCTFSGSDVENIASYLRGLMRGPSFETKIPESYAWTNIIKRLDIILGNAVGIES